MRRPKRLPIEELEPYLLPLPESPTPFHWPDLFGNALPVEMEVGFGKGLFLVQTAQTRRDTNFVGIEIIRKYQLFTANRIAKRSLDNVRLACADARVFLRDLVPPASLHTLYAFYPDPWWKKRHHKRRLFTPEFVRECERVLEPDRYFHIITDVEEYFHIIEALIEEHTTFERMPDTDAHVLSHDLDHLTNFERKARIQGRSIHRLTLRRTAVEKGDASIF